MFDPLVRYSNFDYYQTFDEPGTAVSGRGRWGDVTPVAAVDSADGRELVESRFDVMTDELERYMDTVDAYVTEADGDYSDLWETRDDEFVRHSMYQAGRYSGWPVMLYDNDGVGIQNREHLDDAVEEWCPEALKAYVVPTDVHW